MSERRVLQFSIAIAAVLPIAGGLWGIVQPTLQSAWADNHHRYLSGLLMAIGLGFWSTVPEIETMTARVQLLTAVVVAGGLARLCGLAMGDEPTLPVMAALAMELCVTPLLCLWQRRIASRLASPKEPSAWIARLKPHLRHIAT